MPGAQKGAKRASTKKPAARRAKSSAAGRESKKRLHERAARILWLLDAHLPHSRCSLDHRNAFELLIATLLSAQCTDARVNMVTKDLFRRAPDPAALAAVPLEELEELVRSTGFFRNKAKNARATAERITTHYGGQVPSTMEDLLTLPGVARKTANCVLGTWFQQPVGVVVDTHVTRIARLLGLTQETDPQKIERDLVALLPEEHWVRFTHQIIDHGRATCVANRPRCDGCFLRAECPSAG